MAFQLERIHAEKNRIVDALFIATADDNYIVARWCFDQALNVDFFWLGVHALEKYMKAVLLLNGQSGKGYKDAKGKSKSYGHDIEVLYQNVVNLAASLLPSTLAKPAELDIDHWHVEAPVQFIKRLHDYGNADNRYQVFGYTQLEDDLFKLDTMVFVIRKLCRPLDAYMLPQGHGQTGNPTHRKVLAANPAWWGISSMSPLEKAIAGKRGKRLQHVVLNLNMPFAPKDYVHVPVTSRFSAQNPVLKRAIFDPCQRRSDFVSAGRRDFASVLNA